MGDFEWSKFDPNKKYIIKFGKGGFKNDFTWYEKGADHPAFAATNIEAIELGNRIAKMLNDNAEDIFEAALEEGDLNALSKMSFNELMESLN